MALTLISHGSKTVAIGYDDSTGERGFLVKMINRTGHTSVKGELITASTSADLEAVLQTNTYDVMGVVAEAGIAEGSEMWIWCNGSIAQVLWKDSTAAVHGEVLVADAVDGRGSGIANFGGGLPATEAHFAECGHVVQSKDAGTNVLVLCFLHFN